MILNIVMLIKRSKHRYNKNSERHIGTTLCSFSMFAFSIVSAIKSPSLLRAAMPELSVLIDLMYWNSLLGLA
jgi:hypothetical protein